MKYTVKTLLLILLVIPFYLTAQPGSTTEEAVSTAGLFIDGLREKALGNHEKAASIFEEVLQKEPNNAAVAYELSRTMDTLNKLDKAIEFGTKAVDTEPDNPWFKMHLAGLLQKNNQDLKAADLYKDLVKKEPYNEEHYYQWAYHLVRAGKPAEAVKVYNELEKLVGINEEISRKKHNLYTGIGDYKKAVNEIERLIERFPKKTAYRHLLATFYEQINQREQARAIYQEILELDPDDARSRIALAEEAKGNDDMLFLQSLKPVFENPDVELDTKVKELLPYVQKLADTQDLLLGNTLLALASLLETVHPGSAKVYSLLGDVLYYTGRPDRALEMYRKCLSIDETVWQVWEQTLFLLAQKKAHRELLDRANDAIDIFPNQATAYYYYAVGARELGKTDDALGALQQALIMVTHNQPLRFNLLLESGKSYCQLGQYSNADNAFAEALELSERAEVALLAYAHCLLLRSDADDKAIEMATELINEAPDRPEYNALMAELLYRSENFTAARSRLDNALANGAAEDPGILERYGDVLFQLGLPAEALEYWRKALEKGGQSSELERKVLEGKMHD